MVRGPKWVWVKLLLMVVLLENCWSEGCWEQERVALLQLKHFFSIRVEGDENNSDCCQWGRVVCNNNTGRVMELHLSSARGLSLRGWYLNASLFSPFQELEWLDLSFNLITENEGDLTGLSRLKNLKFLDLGSNYLKNSILSRIDGLSSLTTLYLYDNILNGTIYIKEIDSLSNLEELDFRGNNINKFVAPKDYRGLRMLKSLRLGTSRWYYDGGIYSMNVSSLLQSLWTPFPNLDTLKLRDYHLGQKMTNQELLNFTNLEVLILGGSALHIRFLQSIAVLTSVKHLSMRNCYLYGTSDFQDFPKFRRLENLVMDYSEIHISFPQISKSMVSLKFLSLVSCGLNGTILNQGLCELVHLQELHIGYNNIGGTLPWCLANMTSLRILDIASNQITGNISSSPLRYLTSLEELRVSNNQFQIPISFEPFFNHSKLKKFYGQKNRLFVEIESHSLTPKFQLQNISLSGCRYDGTFPRFLYYQHELRYVDLSHMNLRGEFPNWLLENNKELETLLLANNSLSGFFQMPVNPLKQLTTIDVSKNFIQGHIPTGIGAFLPRLEHFNISRNVLNGSIPCSFGDISSLRSLDLSNNRLTGEIPEHMTMGCFSLQVLAFSNNSLQGHIFSRSFNLTNLVTLQLDANQFTGGIPENLLSCSLLGGLYLSDNHISGKIPKWLGNLSNLVDIIMPNNHLEGPIPANLCKLNFLTVLDLEVNNISGSLPSCFSSWLLTQVHLSRNKIEGQLEDVFGDILMTLDLSYNRFSGRIPNWIDKLSHLSYLILANNNLEGEVPVQLCLLKQLQLIDLSHNNLSGTIPSCLYKTALGEGNYDSAAPTSEGNYGASSPAAGEAVSPSGSSTMRKEESVEFRTKNTSYYYQGRILKIMFGLDLSCNKLTGEIPFQIGYLNMIRVLNLSHNNLMGTIPSTFSHLSQIESLDLSYNMLQGKIPTQLVELYALAIFSVAHNNLSGKVPDRVGQFATFTENSYDGNSLLCGQPLSESCYPNGSPNVSVSNEEDDDNFIDMGSFYITFIISYVIVILGIFGVLYVNPYWRRRWFYLIETYMASCYYLLVDHLIPPRFCLGNK